jgi:hypothetical protein
MESAGGEIVGSISNIPASYHFRGELLLGAASAGWVVDADYRCFSLALLNRFAEQKDVDLTFSTTTSRFAEVGFRIFRFSRVPLGRWDQSAFWITDYLGFLNGFLKKKSTPLARILRYPTAAALVFRNKLRNSGLEEDTSRWDIEPCTEFDGRFDEFWEELTRENPNSLLSVRTSEALRWHFSCSLKQQNVWILTAARGSRLVAYAIFDRQDRLDWDLKRVRLVDFQFLKSFEGVLRSALIWTLNECRNQGIHMLECGCLLDRPGFPKIAAPYRRTLHSWLYYYKAKPASLSNTLQAPDVWAPSFYDGDASL